MSIQINIQGTLIEFPSSGASPDWSPAIIQFAQAVEAALANVAGAFDVAPQVLNIDAYNPGSNISINALSFPVSQVRAATISYAVFRQTSTNTVSESGEIRVNYNPDGLIGNKWQITRDYQDNANISFAISDTGQISFTTTTLAGTNHTGAITFAAKALLQTS
jgi:hypothetical protein